MATKGPDLQYVRGDTVPLRLTLKKGGSTIDLTGFTALEITVNSEETPVNTDNQIATLTGALTGTPTDGSVDFSPVDQVTSDALIPGEYFYDIAGVDADSNKVTFAVGGNFEIQQDIGKS